MTLRLSALCYAAAIAVIAGITFAALPSAQSAPQKTADDGVVRVSSAFAFDETVSRLKSDIAGKGIMFFMEVDQSSLGASAGIKIAPSKLLVFGNPPLGIQFLTSNPNSGLDWPVRLLVTQDQSGKVWATYTDFAWIARRHHIEDRDAAFKMASEVIASITSSIEK
jgi:uncharacterized protein (DUF302 family)